LFAKKDLYYNLVHSLLLDAIDSPEDTKLKQWQHTISLMLTKPELKSESIGESSNLVYTIGPSRYLKSTFVFKEHPELEVLIKEHELRDSFDELTKYFKWFKLPEVVVPPSAYKIQGKVRYVYVMRRAPGNNLMELLNSSLEEAIPYLYRIAEFLAYMHTNIQPELSERGKLSIAFKLRSRLLNRELRKELLGKLTFREYRNLMRRIVSSYRPVYDDLMNLQWCFNLDSHPEQYIISADRVITRVDTEDKGITPQQFDLVNLLEYTPKLSDEAKKAVIQHYVNCFNSYLTSAEHLLPIIDMSNFMRGYYNSVIQRAISLCSAWSSTTRKSMRAHRKIMLQTAKRAINQLSREHEEYYGAYRSNYEMLWQALDQLSKALT